MLKKILTSVLIIAVGAVVLVLGISGVKNSKTYIKTDAVITDITDDYDSIEDEHSYTVIVRYTAEGEEYEEELGFYKNGYEVSKQIEICYNPENPTQIQPAGAGTFVYFLIAGIATLLCGVVLLIKRR